MNEADVQLCELLERLDELDEFDRLAFLKTWNARIVKAEYERLMERLRRSPVNH